MDPISIVSIDDPPWSFNQLPIDEDVHRPEFGNDPTTFGQHGERPTSAFHSRESCEGIPRMLLGDELDDALKVKSRGVCPEDLEVSHLAVASAAP